MSNANLQKVKSMVYENLGITEGNYGTLEVNQRYPSGYIDDAIAGADLTVMKTLLKSKQYHFAPDFFEQINIPSGVPIPLPVNTELLNVRFYNGSVEEQGVEIPWEMYEMFTEPLASSESSLFSFSGQGGKKYGGYYSVKDHQLHTVPFNSGQTIETGVFQQFTVTTSGDPAVSVFTCVGHGYSNGDVVTLKATGVLPSGYFTNTTYYIVNKQDDTFRLAATSGGTALPLGPGGTGNFYVAEVTSAPSPVGYFKYISLEHPSSLGALKSPKSFEEAIAFLASANLLMKRANNPSQSTFYLQQYQAMMGLYMSPSTNQQRTIDQ